MNFLECAARGVLQMMRRLDDAKSIDHVDKVKNLIFTVSRDEHKHQIGQLVFTSTAIP